MHERSGPFWEAMQGQEPLPRPRRRWGWSSSTADTEAGTIELAFTATEASPNPTGNVVGAFNSLRLLCAVKRPGGFRRLAGRCVPAAGTAGER
jgi:hypothetical protein